LALTPTFEATDFCVVMGHAIDMARFSSISCLTQT